MANLQDLINLAKVDGGKFFVLDETGEARLVILPVEHYKKLLLGKLQKQTQDIENINQEILKAQLQETDIIQPEIEKPTKIVVPKISRPPKMVQPDLRAEVIDPSFDFEAPKLDDDF